MTADPKAPEKSVKTEVVIKAGEEKPEKPAKAEVNINIRKKKVKSGHKKSKSVIGETVKTIKEALPKAEDVKKALSGVGINWHRVLTAALIIVGLVVIYYVATSESIAEGINKLLTDLGGGFGRLFGEGAAGLFGGVGKGVTDAWNAFTGTGGGGGGGGATDEWLRQFNEAYNAWRLQWEKDNPGFTGADLEAAYAAWLADYLAKHPQPETTTGTTGTGTEKTPTPGLPDYNPPGSFWDSWAGQGVIVVGGAGAGYGLYKAQQGAFGEGLRPIKTTEYKAEQAKQAAAKAEADKFKAAEKAKAAAEKPASGTSSEKAKAGYKAPAETDAALKNKVIAEKQVNEVKPPAGSEAAKETQAKKSAVERARDYLAKENAKLGTKGQVNVPEIKLAVPDVEVIKGFPKAGSLVKGGLYGTLALLGGYAAAETLKENVPGIETTLPWQAGAAVVNPALYVLGGEWSSNLVDKYLPGTGYQQLFGEAAVEARGELWNQYVWNPLFNFAGNYGAAAPAAGRSSDLSVNQSLAAQAAAAGNIVSNEIFGVTPAAGTAAGQALTGQGMSIVPGYNPSTGTGSSSFYGVTPSADTLAAKMLPATGMSVKPAATTSLLPTYTSGSSSSSSGSSSSSRMGSPDSSKTSVVRAKLEKAGASAGVAKVVAAKITAKTKKKK